MKTPTILFAAFLFSFLTSCQSVAWMISGLHGFKKPKVETKRSVQRFANKLGQDTTDLYCLDTVLFNELTELPFKPGWGSGFRNIQIRTYDKEGLPVMQWASCEGLLDELGTFDTVPPRNFYGLNTSLNLQQDIGRYYTLDGAPANVVVPEGYDYYILVYFAKYFSRYSKDSFNEVEQWIRSHPELKVKVYKINVDFMDFWDYDVTINIDREKPEQ